jgi:DNA-binding MarR family transcriptional regulator
MAKKTASEIATQMATECLGFKTTSLARSISRLYNDALRADGLTMTQYTLLAATNIYQPIQPAELARRINVEKSTLTRNVRLMEQNGWMNTRTGSHVGALSLSVTRKGSNLIKSAQPAWKAAQREARTLLGEGLMTELLRRPL